MASPQPMGRYEKFGQTDYGFNFIPQGVVYGAAGQASREHLAKKQ